MSPGELYLNTLCFLIRGYDDRDLGTQRLMLLQPRVVTLDIVQYDPIGLSAATLPLLRKVTSVCVVTLKISANFIHFTFSDCTFTVFWLYDGVNAPWP